MTAGLTYVVTGGCGFLGSHIVDMLVERGKNISEIRVVDTKLRSYKSPERKGVKVKRIRGDVTDMAQMTEVCAGADVVIHTASLIDIIGLVSYTTLWDVNVKGTETLLQCCLNEDVPCFVYTSTLGRPWARTVGATQWKMGTRARRTTARAHCCRTTGPRRLPRPWCCSGTGGEQTAGKLCTHVP
ncbi:HSD3B7 [Branchiostoma lanceolatum]|uniref:HSD3B7 protein n=1 Tax=Branchiostoma lanceolatum TaxID=7740 RepID=A0A8K0A316_BRALA|nr:HSD3B7 [Branchiostoma lanceolatum]